MKTREFNNFLKWLSGLNNVIMFYDPNLDEKKVHQITKTEKFAFINAIDDFVGSITKFKFDLIIADAKTEKDFLLLNELRDTKIIGFSEDDSFENIYRLYRNGIHIFLPKKDINTGYLKTAIELVLHGYSRIIISKNQDMQKNYELLNFYAKKLKSDVLINGENGTGKGILARAIHILGQRKGEFVVQNCAGIPDTLFESEMFGYVTGAFTGADKRGRIGVFEKANNGILFLDEIGDLPMNQQAKLLRAIQRKIILKVGSSKEQKIETRFIYATNKNLLEEVKEQTFREDFFYRLKGAEITIPPLRDTLEDLEIMIAVFTNRYFSEQSTDTNFDEIKLNYESLEKLKKYGFPGNMRELQKIVYQSLTDMLINGSEELVLRTEITEELPTSENIIPVESFWKVIELMEKKLLKYGGLTDEMKKPVLDHLRTKYKDNRKIVSGILSFRGKQSLSNEISRLTKK